MAQSVLQDYIRLAMAVSREEFCAQVRLPVLISEEQRSGYSFFQGQTRLTREQRKAPLSRELIRRGHMLPVVELRQVQPGPPGQVRVGRAVENDLALRDDSVSSRHAAFQIDPRTGTLLVQDLASMNGTLVNGTRLVVGQPATLFDGDVLSFGDQCFLFFYPAGLYDVLKANLESL